MRARCEPGEGSMKAVPDRVSAGDAPDRDTLSGSGSHRPMTEPVRPPEPEEAPMPAWVYAFGIAVILIALVFVGLHLAGGGIPQH